MKSLSTRSAPLLALSALLLIGGCAVVPTGPSVLSLPGTSKSFDQFRIDDADCRQYALASIGGVGAEQAATAAGVRSAALGTVVGAAAGAAIGGQEGAGIGAGTGLLFGTVAGSGTGQSSSYDSQRRYDHAYIQCMYAKGHRVPVTGSFTQSTTPTALAPAAAVPPPPAATPTSAPAATSATPFPIQRLPAGAVGSATPGQKLEPPPPPPPGNPPPPPPGV
ncbi:glycine zipper family protein [Rhodocyclus purpureus]|uniref:glycine zipper family protein n=1 Tax=Rhodocyclus purpureus TaxID=1067 RepID=UPI00191478D2|nr:glycine zipper family protein [Rhodocyclus purpureus]MBK5913288.1 hypothetical protein [Rhodocyclus purpureus]